MCNFTRVETTIPTFLIKLLSRMYNIMYISNLICIPLVFLRQASSLNLCSLITPFELEIFDNCIFSYCLRFSSKTGLLLQCSIFATMFTKITDTRKRLFCSFNRNIGKIKYSTFELLRVIQGPFRDSIRLSIKERCASIKCSVSILIIFFWHRKIINRLLFTFQFPSSCPFRPIHYDRL